MLENTFKKIAKGTKILYSKLNKIFKDEKSNKQEDTEENKILTDGYINKPIK